MCECQGNPLARVTLALGLPYLKILLVNPLISFNPLAMITLAVRLPYLLVNRALVFFSSSSKLSGRYRFFRPNRQQHGVTIQIYISLSKTFLRIPYLTKIAVA